MQPVKYKSAMKANYAKAGIKTARWHIVRDYTGCKDFVREVGYPVIVKPDNGVGASHTYKLSSDDELNYFFATKDETVYIMEEFVNGTVHSYDAIIDSKGEPLFETGNVTMDSIMDIVNTNGNSCYYIEKTPPHRRRLRREEPLCASGILRAQRGSARAGPKGRHPRSGGQHAPLRRLQRGYVQLRQLHRRV